MIHWAWVANSMLIFSATYHLAKKYSLSKTKLLSIVVISYTKLYFSLQTIDIGFLGSGPEGDEVL